MSLAKGPIAPSAPTSNPHSTQATGPNVQQTIATAQAAASKAQPAAAKPKVVDPLQAVKDILTDIGRYGAYPEAVTKLKTAIGDRKELDLNNFLANYGTYPKQKLAIMEGLGKALSGKELEHLELAHCSLTTQDLTVFADHLKDASIAYLNLEQNALTDDIGNDEKFGELLARADVKELKLAKNKLRNPQKLFAQLQEQEFEVFDLSGQALDAKCLAGLSQFRIEDLHIAGCFQEKDLPLVTATIERIAKDMGLKKVDIDEKYAGNMEVIRMQSIVNPPRALVTPSAAARNPAGKRDRDETDVTKANHGEPDAKKANKEKGEKGSSWWPSLRKK